LLSFLIEFLKELLIFFDCRRLGVYTNTIKIWIHQAVLDDHEV